MKSVYFLLACICLSFLGINQLVAQPKYQVQRLKFNTSSFEFSPQFYEDGIVFCSNFENKAYVTSDKGMQIPLTNIYFSKKLGKKYDLPQLLSPNITTKYHDGPFVVDKANKQVIMTRNILEGDTLAERKNLGVFMVPIEEQGVAKPFEFNSGDYSIGHPTLSPDGQTLYYISDMPGGLGGTDLYSSKRSGDKWSSPVNLGAPINSAGNEMFPYMHPSGTLYFSSDGKGGKGGLDVFMAKGMSNGFGNPEILPEPINSIYDDFGFIADLGMTSGYFSTNRGGSDDVYSFSLRWPKFKGCQEAQPSNLCYVFEEQNQFPNDTLPFTYRWDFGDGNTELGMQVSHCYQRPGTYEVKLDLQDTILNQTQQRVAVYELFVEANEQLVLNHSNEAKVGISVRFHTQGTSLSGDPIWYYWNLGNGFKTIGSEVDYFFDTSGMYDVILGAQYVNNEGKTKLQCVSKQLLVK